MGYNFTIDYKKGKANVIANGLSRKIEEEAATVALIAFPTLALSSTLSEIYSKLQQE